MSLAERAGVWDADRRAAGEDVARWIEADDIKVVRLSFVDQHGITRGKTVTADQIGRALRDGVGFPSTLLLKDTAGRTVFPVWTPGGAGLPEFDGAADCFMLPDPATFRVLPWAPHTGWLICDIHFADGRPVPFATRHLYRRSLDALARAGFDFKAGLEVEFHLFRRVGEALGLEDAASPGQPGRPPQVALLNQGYQYLTEQRYDVLDPILETLRKNVVGLGLKLRSLEVEFGPSQVEFTFDTGIGLEPADAMVLFRNTVKQVAAREGYHATFMCRPRIANGMSSGWHLHQSLVDRATGGNAFVDPAAPLSASGLHFMGGLLAKARAATALACPTINAYRRFKAFSLAPDRAVWGRDNRGAMLRLLGGPGDPATHIENRIGEPAANPYLYMASQVICGLAGLESRRDPGPSSDAPYGAAATPLPRSLGEALEALHASAVLRAGLGDTFIDYFVRLKRAEIERHEAEVSDWEQREYFDLF
ncbi:MAG: glutamine synthetase [Alphaproteobacteria bacterium]|nr:glutamine synthetase [Alphaproteobacteria bacterium]